MYIAAPPLMVSATGSGTERAGALIEHALPGEHLGHSLLQGWYHLQFKPGILSQPEVIPRAGMGHGNDSRPELLPAPHIFGNRTPCAGNMPGMSVLTDQQGQANLDRKSTRLNSSH